MRWSCSARACRASQTVSASEWIQLWISDSSDPPTPLLVQWLDVDEENGRGDRHATGAAAFQID